MRAGLGQRPARALCGLAALAAAAAIAACGSDENGGATTSADEGVRGSGHVMEETIPAQIDQHPHPFVSSDILRPVVNAWRAAGHRRLTQVDAGALANDRSTGAFAIFRHEFVDVDQRMDLVEVKGAGPLRITEAPLGAKVSESAQETGKIEFVGAQGIRGTLDLSDDTVSVRRP